MVGNQIDENGSIGIGYSGAYDQFHHHYTTSSFLMWSGSNGAVGLAVFARLSITGTEVRDLFWLVKLERNSDSFARSMILQWRLQDSLHWVWPLLTYTGRVY